MSCAMCPSTKRLKKRKINKLYTESGLENVLLSGVIEYSCSECGAVYHSYGNMDELHALISKHLIRKKGNLAGAEIRFLRKALGYNSAMFAKLLGIKPETLSRHENAKKKPLASEALDHEIRFLVASKHAPDRDYDLHDQLIHGMGQDLKRINMTHRPSGWRATLTEVHP